MMIQLLRRPHLLDNTVVHHHHPVGQRHRLDLVMSDIHGCGANRLMHFLDLGAHLHSKLGIQVRQRLIEQEHLRVPHDRPTHRHPLPLTARQRPRLSVQQRQRYRECERPRRPAA